MDNKADIIYTCSLLDWAPREGGETLEMGVSATHRATTAEPAELVQPVQLTCAICEEIGTS